MVVLTSVLFLEFYYWKYNAVEIIILTITNIQEEGLENLAGFKLSHLGSTYRHMNVQNLDTYKYYQ